MESISQTKLNEDMLTLGVGRYRSKVESAQGRDAEIETKYGQALMRFSLPKYTEKIKEWKDTVITYKTPAKYQIDIQELSAKVLAFISVKSIIDSITKRRSLSQVAIFLGARVEDELRCRFLLKNNEAKGKGILLGAKKRKGLKAKVRHVRSSMKHEVEKGLMPEFQRWGVRDKLNMGLNAIELFRYCTGLIEYVYILERAGRKPTRFVSPTKELLEWIENYNEKRGRAVLVTYCRNARALDKRMEGRLSLRRKITCIIFYQEH